MTESPKKRQTKAQRRSAILQAAGEAFFLQGYAATSIDSIIERLGGSKRAIYQEFGSKEGLFVAFVSESTDLALAALNDTRIEHHDLRETLVEFGCDITSALLTPGFLGVYRSILTEALRFPELTQAYYTSGPGKAEHRLAQVLNSAKNRGEIQLEDCAVAAGHLVGMLRGNLHMRVVLGLSPSPSQKEIEKYVASAVDIFLHGIRGASSLGADPRRIATKTAKKKAAKKK
jgi:AcrR family transcriptional regulator